MINSQLPFNQLVSLKERLKVLNFEYDSAETECLRSLDFLNGVIYAIDDPQVFDFIYLMRLADLRFSLELEGVPISLSRLLEGLSSENALNDEQIEGALKYLDWCSNLRILSIEKLRPVFLKSFQKGADQIRDKKESVIKSYFTNLTLYTAPQNNLVIKELRQDLDLALGNTKIQKNLKTIAQIHYQIRALSPYNAFNGLVARTYQNLCLRLLDVEYDFIPLSTFIAERKEKYQALMREAIIKDNLIEWQNFLIKATTDAAKRVPIQIRKFLRLKSKLKDMIAKYPSYPLPIELTEVIMSRPYIKAAYVLDKLNCHRQTAYMYLKQLVKMGILVERYSGREKMYFNKELYDLLNE
ncbi:MAG: hypothetical protein IT245_04550 [Bacteroidia bacterium]|nr:hypothetical protein [Bacteroidia bacterium]